MYYNFKSTPKFTESPAASAQAVHTIIVSEVGLAGSLRCSRDFPEYVRRAVSNCANAGNFKPH